MVAAFVPITTREKRITMKEMFFRRLKSKLRLNLCLSHTYTNRNLKYEFKDSFFGIRAFLCKQHFYNQRHAEICKKFKQIRSNIPRLSFFYLKIIYILHPRYHPKIMVHILKNKQKNKCGCIHEIMRSIVMKMGIEMKIKSRHK